ncbi:hypothetical protein F4553_001397 [Allocatelliglobosispora scoriae]|uniref:Uncharacterized protein n=1 Tax=Allocatelliglobosispora scoriae TaxID=643052 RepID=A0A841BKX6_9ACTN|nr:hypothetical protein [Allocatelliglobosispora scoriae]MBB5868018.1 hypothetical protein [Allocatelliglobosispora scoriae]
MSTHGGFDQLGPGDYAGETEAARERDVEQVPVVADPTRPTATNDDIERLHEPVPEATTQ